MKRDYITGKRHAQLHHLDRKIFYPKVLARPDFDLISEPDEFMLNTPQKEMNW